MADARKLQHKDIRALQPESLCQAHACISTHGSVNRSSVHPARCMRRHAIASSYPRLLCLFSAQPLPSAESCRVRWPVQDAGTPLHYAVVHGTPEAVAVLLSFAPDTGMRNPAPGQGPLASPTAALNPEVGDLVGWIQRASRHLQVCAAYRGRMRCRRGANSGRRHGAVRGGALWARCGGEGVACGWSGCRG